MTPRQIIDPPSAQNTDRELWREREGDYYADSIHVTQGGGIGIDCGGHVIVKPIREWHKLAASQSLVGVQCREDVARAVEAAADAMWRVHPQELQDRGITRKQFYIEKINEVLALPHTGQPQEGWRTQINKIMTAWDSLPRGHHSGNAIERWLNKDIGPVIQETRALLSAAPASPREVHERESPVVPPIGQERS